jgi:hypothetical protein
MWAARPRKESSPLRLAVAYEVRFLKMMLTRIREVTRSLLTMFLTMSW